MFLKLKFFRFVSEIYHLKPPLINITEQTKIRLKELEMQISQHDFDIEQAKQRTYSYLTPEPIKDFFRKAVCGDI